MRSTNLGGCELGGALPEPLIQETSKLLAQCPVPVENKEAASRLWTAALFWLTAHTSPSQHARPKIGAILSAFDVSLEAFLRELPVPLARAGPMLPTPRNAGDLEAQVGMQQLQLTFVYGKVLSKKTRDLLDSHVTSRPQARDDAAAAPNNNGPAALHRLAWLLFLVVKHRLLPPHPDLVSLFHLLLAVVAALRDHAPWAPAIIGGSPDVGGGRDGGAREEPVSTLAALAAAHKASAEEAEPLARALGAFLRDVLAPAAGLEIESPRAATLGEAQQTSAQRPASGTEAPELANGRSAAGPSVVIRGLLTDAATLTAATAALDDMYQTLHEADDAPGGACEVDERPFIEGGLEGADGGSRGAAGDRKLPGGAASGRHVNGAEHAGGLLGSPFSPVGRHLLPNYYGSPPGPGPLSPATALPASDAGFSTPSPRGPRALGPAAAGIPPATPVSAALTASSWLRRIGAEFAAEPSPWLQRLIDAAGIDVGPAIARRVNEAADAVMPMRPPSALATQLLQYLQPASSTERRLDGIKLYYRVLESMMRDQEAKGGRASTAALLRSDAFHRALLALSFEMVVASYRMATLAFPAVLDRLALAPFDVAKLVHPFQGAAPALPAELNRHLFLLEERSLESLAWEAGSSLYPLLVTAAGGTPPPPEDTPQRKQEPRTPDPVGHPLTPEADPGARPRGSALGSAHAADALQNGSGATLDLGRELSLAMALQFPAAHEAAPDAQQSPARPAGSPSGQATERQSPVSRVLAFSSNADGADNNAVVFREHLENAAVAANNGEDGRLPQSSPAAMDHDAAEGAWDSPPRSPTRTMGEATRPPASPTPAGGMQVGQQAPGSGEALADQADDGYDSPPDSPVGRAPIAPLPTNDGGSPMTPRKARVCGLLGPLPGRVAVETAHRVAEPPAEGDLPAPDSPGSPERVGIATPSALSPLQSPRKRQAAAPARSLGAPALQSPVCRLAAATEARQRSASGVHAPGQPPLPAAFVDQRGDGGVSPSAAVVAKARRQVADFLARVLKLAGLRLSDLCDRLSFGPVDRNDMLAQVYTVVDHLVYGNTSLLYGRHLDQLLLAATYGVCKVHGLKQMSFKEIIHHYRQQPQARSEVFRSVTIFQARHLHSTDPQLTVQKTGDVIEYYNATFIPVAKSLLIRVGAGKQPLKSPPVLPPHLVPLSVLAASSGAPAEAALLEGGAQASASGFSTPPPMRRALDGGLATRVPIACQVSNARNITVSPMRPEHKSPFATQRARSLVAHVGDERASISASIAAINSAVEAAARKDGVPMPAAMSADSGASDATHLRSTSVLPASVLLRRSGSGGRSGGGSASASKPPATAEPPLATIAAAMVLQSLDPANATRKADGAAGPRRRSGQSAPPTAAARSGVLKPRPGTAPAGGLQPGASSGTAASSDVSSDGSGSRGSGSKRATAAGPGSWHEAAVAEGTQPPQSKRRREMRV